MRQIFHRGPDNRGRLKPLASVQEALDDTAFDVDRLELGGRPKSNDDIVSVNIHDIDRFGHGRLHLLEDDSDLVREVTRVVSSPGSSSDQAGHFPMLERTKSGLGRGDFGRDPTLFQKLDEVAAFPPARGQDRGTSWME